MKTRISTGTTAVAATVAITVAGAAAMTFDWQAVDAQPTPTTESPYAVLPAIAAWADANGYTGLSPAYLVKITTADG
ncbi:MAG TPA: hypothetical protein VMS14_02465 [Ilumatobacteraceae bacterium]|nr:hypothetical protein [Ilumatobacteraceae bacterium]